jgi:nicotinate-nucleotide adenylyltransferase
VRYAILGGSFNPPHLGHLFLADEVLSGLGYDRVILVPAYISPFKPGVQDGSAADRLDMLAASLPGDGRISVDDCEIRRGGVSYTVDTLRDITKRYPPGEKPGLILGDDLVRGFPKWKDAEEIAALADLIVAHRLSAAPVSLAYPHRQLTNEVMELSSGNVRERIQQGKSWRYLVPQGARFIIEDRRLYGYRPPGVPAGGEGTPATQGLSLQHIARIEEAVRSMVSPVRFLHSRNTAILARDLCLRYGLDPLAGYLAGIAHDMCKSLGEQELFALARAGGGGISKLEKKKPSLLHARAAAFLLRDRFGVKDEDVLEAVRFHTTGRAGMGLLAKLVYVADKIEPSREDLKPEFREWERYPDPDSLFAAVLDDAVAYLRSRKYDLSEGTTRLLEAIHKRSAP